MKNCGLWVLLFAVGATLTVLLIGFSSPDVAFTTPSATMTIATTNRKLKEYGHDLRSSKKKGSGHVNLDDYHPIDPVPSSKASVKPGPIQHGSPIIPYIPKPSPPSRPGRPGLGNGSLN